jgi:hypothetical protein
MTSIKFEPFNWYKKGLTPVRYYLLASRFEHDFDNIEITNVFEESEQKFIIQGKCFIDEDLCNFETKISVNSFGNSRPDNEGDFNVLYENVNYRIETTIINPKSTKIKKYKMKDPIPDINLNFPLYIKKLAMIVLHLDI